MLGPALIGAATSGICAVAFREWARAWRVEHKVGASRRREARSLPPVGGLAFALGGVAGLLSRQSRMGLVWTDQTIGLALACGVILVVGLIDDFVRELSPGQKLLGQGVAWLLLAKGGMVTQIMLLPPWANLLVSLLWTVTIINAINLLDIADGLAGGIALIALLTLLVLSLLTGQVIVAGSLGVLAGSLVGVLVFNLPRASLFLGDSGSMLVGLLLAAFTILVSYAPVGREIALLTPLLVLGLPLYDLAFVILMRLRRGRSIVKKSPDHFVFRLMRQGCSPRDAMTAMFVLALAFSLAALLVGSVSNAVGALTVGLVLLVAVGWGVRMARVNMDA